MPSADRLVALALTAFVLIAIPGPSVLFVVSRSVTLGRRAGLATVVGNAAGIYVQAIAVAIGIGSIVERSVAVFEVIKLAGAAYLVFLGIQAFRARRRLAAAFDPLTPPKSGGRLVRDGFVVGVTNPKAIVIFTAVLPQFADPAAGHVPLQLLVFGLIFVLIALVSDGMWALAAGTARQWLVNSPRRLEAVGGAGGIVMIGLGLHLAIGGRKD
jgi:threonine/homoserine/homoserine lactone efflux protein